MIASLKGLLINKSPSECVIEANGVGYLCYISNNTYDVLPMLNEEFFLLTYHQVSENNQSLYGFSEQDEKELFLMLISVSGIGPKTGINLLSSVSTNEFKRRLMAGEVELLSSLPGIGPKTAKRIIIELKDRFTYVDNDMPIESGDGTQLYQDSYNALKSLGFNRNEINNSLNELISSNDKFDAQGLIREALKLLKNK